MRKILSGSEAVAYGAKLSNVQVVSAYPITPQTPIVEHLAQFFSQGAMKGKYIKVESEFSAMSVCVSAAATGARTFTATSSHGLALMHEMLFWAAGSRLPIVMVNANRTMGGPWNIWPDHTDSLPARDTGWIQCFVETNQEVLDTIIMSYKISEKLLLPIMVCMDGFILTHNSEPVDIPDEKEVSNFLPKINYPYKLDTENPKTYGSMIQDGHNQLKYLINKGMENEFFSIFKNTEDEYYKQFGRKYGLIEECFQNNKDSEIIVVSIGTITGTARHTIDILRKKGESVGLVKIKSLRPFPKEEIINALSKCEKIVVLDRNISYGSGGVFATEIRSALYNLDNRPKVYGYITGLCGSDVTPELIEKIIIDAKARKKPELNPLWPEIE
jgi:pyruvate/2-oxoacid:ferredoxin oxidoreductase alpha subunit